MLGETGWVCGQGKVGEQVVEWHGVVELDMQELVEVMTEVQVGSVDWAMCPEVWMDFGSWVCPACKLPTVAW